MAGIHLPDIGKLGIHVATGVNDKKKVAPMNNAEEARLKAFLKRVENQKYERVKVIKKEFRRMKGRKKRIDQRLEDIGKSKTIPLTIVGKHLKQTADDMHLPPVLKAPIHKTKKLQTFEQKDVIIEHEVNSELVSKITVFPIQDELENQNITTPSNYGKNAAKLPPLQSQIPHELYSNGYQKSQRPQRKISTVQKGSSESSSKKAIKKMSVATLGSNNETSEFSSDGDRSVGLGDKNLLFLGFDAAEILDPRQPQRSLEDAMIAIKTCRYLRTPSRQEHTNQNVYSDA